MRAEPPVGNNLELAAGNAETEDGNQCDNIQGQYQGIQQEKTTDRSCELAAGDAAVKVEADVMPCSITISECKKLGRGSQLQTRCERRNTVTWRLM